MPLSVLIVLGLFGIYLMVSGHRGVQRAQAAREEDPDGSTLDALARAGSDLTREHLVEFYLYLPRETVARKVGEILNREGFETDIHQVDPPRGDWSVLAAKRMRPELAPLRAVRERLTALMDEHDGEYDGWGTLVEEDNDGG